MTTVDHMYTEDVFKYSSKLSDGEKKVLAHLREQLEEKIRPHLIDATENAYLPRDVILDVFSTVRIMDHPDLFEGRDNKWRTSEIEGNQ